MTQDSSFPVLSLPLKSNINVYHFYFFIFVDCDVVKLVVLSIPIHFKMITDLKRNLEFDKIPYFVQFLFGCF